MWVQLVRGDLSAREINVGHVTCIADFADPSAAHDPRIASF